LKVAINLLFLDKNYVGGISQFTRGLVKGLAHSIPPEATLTFFCSRKTGFAVESILSSNQVSFVFLEDSLASEVPTKPSRIPYWLKYRLPLRFISAIKYRELNKTFQSFDLVYVPHGPTAIFPFPRVPTVYSIHDIQHEYYPQFFSKQQLLGRKKTFAMCVRHAAALQASSNFMKTNFLETYAHLKSNDIFLAPEGVDREFWQIRDTRSTIASFPLSQDHHYIFLPAQLWMHKNHITVFQALRILRDQGLDVHLIMTGARFDSSQPIFDMITELAIEDLVHYLGIVSREDLRWLFQHADCVISAALYESSSLPILEAAACLVPVIAGDAAPNLEMSEKIQISIVANLDPNSWADAIRQNRLESDKRTNSIEYLQDYDWSEIAKLYWNEFKRLTN
jgi:glycosyltransferase involved in cell wall biosynthesis